MDADRIPVSELTAAGTYMVSELPWWIMGMMVTLVVGIAVSGVALVRTGQGRWSWRRLVAEESGVATIEFTMIIPIMLFMILLLTQATHYMAGHIFLRYASFAASRVAAVQIPRDLQGEPLNSINAGPGSVKFDAIHASASYALAPISGERNSNGQGVDGGALVSGLSSLYGALGHDTPNWVNRLAEARVNYAADHTEIEILRYEVVDNLAFLTNVNDEGFHQFGPKSPVGVRVKHRINLGISYVSWIFADDKHSDGDGHYAEGVSVCMLPIEGIHPGLPPAPEIPRRN